MGECEIVSESRSGRYTGLIVKTGIVPRHDMDFAIPWIPRFIHNS